LPGFYFLHLGNLPIIGFILILFTIASAFEQATTPVAIVENFPSRTRYTGISLGYNIGNGFLGGTVPLICQWLLVVTNFYLAPALYIAICALITGFVVLFYIPETAGIKL
jgi:MHS family proline/betaine transporter-like MFS transporter